MMRYFFPLLLAGLTGISCATSVPTSDESVVATEISVANGRNPVLYVTRNPEDGQWVFLTDERAGREVVVYASFQDLLARDSSLNQIRDLRVGWQARRSSKGAPWVREPFLETSKMAGSELSQDRPVHRPGGMVPARPVHYSISISCSDESSSPVRRVSVEEKTVSVWFVEGQESSTETLQWSDTLAQGARALLDSLVQSCGLDTLKELYANPGSAGNKKFVISIWDPVKERSVWTRLTNCWVPSLRVLCSHVNALLPARYAMDLALPEGAESPTKDDK